MIFKELSNLKYPTTVGMEGKVGQDRRDNDIWKLKSRERLGQCIWAKMKWSAETKSGGKEIREEIRAMFGFQMKW